MASGDLGMFEFCKGEMQTIRGPQNRKSLGLANGHREADLGDVL